MDCSQIKQKICGYIDKDLDGKCCLEIEEHLKTCTSCKSEYNELKKLVELCKSQRDMKMPDELRKKIFEDIKKINCNKE